MIIDLPIINNNKLYYHKFTIEKKGNNIIIDLYNSNIQNIQDIKIHLINSFNCFNQINIMFPFELQIYNNIVFNEYFMIFSILSDLQFNDFLNNLNNHLNNIYKLTYIKLDNIQNVSAIIHNNFNNYITNLPIKYNNIYTFLIIFFKKINYINNIILANIYFGKIFSLTKKQQQIKTLFLDINFMLCGSTYKFINHLKYIKDNKISFNEPFIYYKNKKIKIIKYNNNNLIFKNNNFGCEYNIKIYNLSNFSYYNNSLTNKNNIFKHFCSKLYFEIIINKYYKQSNEYNDLFNYLIDINKYDKILVIRKLNLFFFNIEDKYKDILQNDIITTSYVSFDLFIKSIKKKSFDINILKKLFDFNPYPNNNNKTITNEFYKILFYTFKFYDDFCINKDEILKSINFRIKNIYIILTNFYKYYHKNLIQDFKKRFYFKLDNINYDILFTLFNSNYNSYLFYDLKRLDKFKNIIISFNKIIQILEIINWKNLNYRYKYLKILINNNLLLENNNNYNINYNIKKILYNPIIFFNFLKKQSDYIKWSIFLKDNIQNIYKNKIKIYSEDNIKIGKLIFLLHQVKNQSDTDIKYIKFVNFCKLNPKLILYNDKINIKIKEIYYNNNINLGFLAKTLYFDNNKLELMDDSEDNDDKLILKEKYYKYKTKYFQIKYIKK